MPVVPTLYHAVPAGTLLTSNTIAPRYVVPPPQPDRESRARDAHIAATRAANNNAVSSAR